MCYRTAASREASFCIPTVHISFTHTNRVNSISGGIWRPVIMNSLCAAGRTDDGYYIWHLKDSPTHWTCTQRCTLMFIRTYKNTKRTYNTHRTSCAPLQYSPKSSTDFMHQCDLMAALFYAAGWGISAAFWPCWKSRTYNCSLLTDLNAPR